MGEEDGADELAIFGGQTRVLVSKLLSSKSLNRDYKKPQTTSSSGTSSETLSPADISKSKLMHNITSTDKNMEDIHPSLMEYMGLFPPSAFTPDPNQFTAFDSSQATLDQTIMSGVSAFPQFITNTGSDQRTYPQLLPGCVPAQQHPSSSSQNHHQQEQYLSMTSVESPSSSIPNSFPYQSSFNLSSDHNLQAYATTTPESVSSPETAGSGDDITDLGMMMNGDSGMDEQWIAFMRESGILERSNTAGAGNGT